MKEFLHDYNAILLVNGKRIAKPDEFADGNVVLYKTEIFDVFIFEGNKGSVVLGDFAMVG